MNTAIIISIALSAATLIAVVFLFSRTRGDKREQIFHSIEEMMRKELKENRQELADALRINREELANGLDKLTNRLEEKLRSMSETMNNSGKDNRTELAKSLKEFKESFDSNVKDFNELQRQKFGQLEVAQEKLVKSTEERLEKVRETVDEKLQKTLNERLGQSFKQVGEQLESVQKGLGEMQTLAQDVGGLKKVLSNVKMRGGFGEIQLSMLLENILAPDQYEPNVKTKKGSDSVVEFAVKLPGKDDSKSHVWLPIDAKFPKDAYEQLQVAHEQGDSKEFIKAEKNLIVTIKNMAKDISEKYIDPPNTTDFAILFLPFEGIYAEVVKKAALLEEIQRSYKVIVTGPTTLHAILNSLQMGFKTLAIQKRSSEVWEILGAVKTEFKKFGGMLEKAQKNIQTGLNQLDLVKGTRARAIERKLRSVESLNKADTAKILPELSGNDSDDLDGSDDED